MRPELQARLRCPKCGGTLVARAFETGEAGEVVSGILLCAPCRYRFPILNHIPVMLLFRTAFHADFERRLRDALAPWADYAWPDETPLPGERTVQETFTEEWASIRPDEDALSFTYTKEDLVNLNREVWLKWLKETPEAVESVLVVGCGVGVEAQALGILMPRAEIFAFDINLSVLRSGRALAGNARLHITLCSLYHPPFPERSFDLVYSQGVIHHNHSTREAFRSIVRFVGPEGHLFVWVYGLDDHLLYEGLAGFVVRCGRLAEEFIRPVVSRLPGPAREAFFRVAGALLHPLILTRVRHKKQWRFKDTLHGLRDWLSPRYAHRHSYNQVLEWFEREGFRIIDVQSPAAYFDLFKKRLWGVGVTGRRLS